MDLHMPGIDGFETSKKIHEKKPNIPIIALTADMFEDVEEQIQEYGINGCKNICKWIKCPQKLLRCPQNRFLMLMRVFVP